jgi:BirA family biotin operon repressor/biotin-[acetyl-CoA-carboxylase] ligase
MLISSDLTLINRMHLSFALSIALYHFVRSKVLDNAEVRIKWPNDILINGKKVAGILIETGMKAQNRNLSYLNIGIGINIETYPTIQGREITALNQHSNVINTPGDLVENLKQTILFWLDEVKLYQWEELKSLWVSYAYNFRKEITTTYQGTKITGIFEDLEYDGALLMRLASGKCIRIDNSELL